MNKKKIVLDPSRKFNAIFAVELPFWVSIESGTYTLPNEEDTTPPRELNLRNDLWLLSMGNIVDDKPENVQYYAMNEKQIEKQDIIDKLLDDRSQCYQKRKMKTTLTRPVEIIPVKGVVTAKTGTPEWIAQVEKVLMTTIPFEKHLELLDDINSLIDYYVAIVNPVLSFGDVRRVGFFDVMFRVVINVKTESANYLHSLRYTQDIKMADLPYPPYRVKVKGYSHRFKEAMMSPITPSFHQIQWAQTINHLREGRPQDALLSCAIVLEALAYQYWTKMERGNRGMARWLERLNHPQLQNEFNDAAKLWRLRNKVVHEQRVLTQTDVRIIMAGIKALTRLRTFFLLKLEPEILKIQKGFSSFLEPLYPSVTKEPVGKFMPMNIEWLREMDHYERRQE